MRAIITDIRAGKAAALAEDGAVHLVDAKNRAVGQEIRIPAKHRRRWKKPLTWAACAAVLCGMATTGVYAAYEPYASVSVVGGTDSVEYTVTGSIRCSAPAFPAKSSRRTAKFRGLHTLIRRWSIPSGRKQRKASASAPP